MKTLYLECNMGAAGDMLMAALLELLPEQKIFLEKMNHLGLPNVHISCIPVQKCGIWGSHVSVSVDGQEEHSEDVHLHTHCHSHEHSSEHEHCHSHEHSSDHEHCHSHEHSSDHERCHSHEHGAHSHYSYQDICHVIGQLDLPESVKSDAQAVYHLIGEAEAHAHHTSIEQIHFHEVGSLDAITDVIGCCLLFYMLNVSQIIASPIHVGSGSVRCAHGILPVPAPATAHILMGVPIYSGQIQGELCTPTGAAILKYFVKKFGAMPMMKVEKIGYGMGNKDFEAANCVRALLGTSNDGQDEIAQLCCNLDDMTPEMIGFAINLMMQAGALDAFATPIVMKKSRPAQMLTCLCRLEDQEQMTKLLFTHTTTLGVRANICQRSILSYEFRTAQTPYGPVRIKCAQGYGVHKEKPEYEDLREAAVTHQVSIAQVQSSIK